MNISEFIRLVDSEFRAARPGHFIENIELSVHLKHELNQLYGSVGTMSTINGIPIKENNHFSPFKVRANYKVSQGDYQDFDFQQFETLPFGNTRLAICSPPVFGSAQLSGMNPYTIQIPGNFSFSGNYNSAIPSGAVLWDGTSLTLVEEPKSPGCSHSWKKYHGFTEVYDFCEKCDKKRT